MLCSLLVYVGFKNKKIYYIFIYDYFNNRQKQQEASLDAELEKLEKEIEDLSKQTTKQKEKVDIPSQRVKYISQTINKWKNEVQERR